MDIPSSSATFTGISAAEFHTCGLDAFGQVYAGDETHPATQSGARTIVVPTQILT